MSDRALFAIAPYVAALVFILATLVRLSRDRQATSATSAATVATAATAATDTLFRGHRLSALTMVMVVGTHVAMWVSPALLLAWNGPVTHVIAIEIPLFALGVAAAFGLLTVMIVPRRPPGLADTILLGVLAVAIASGLALTVRYRWASTWSAVTLTPYVHSLVALQPNAELLAMPYLVKLHVFSGIALVAVLPFTSVMHRVLRPIHRLLDRLIVPVVDRATRRAKRAAS
jgi:nitrate reductase gamma subunit